MRVKMDSGNFQKLIWFNYEKIAFNQHLHKSADSGQLVSDRPLQISYN